MSVTQDQIMAELRKVALPGGSNLVESDLVRALTLEFIQNKILIIHIRNSSTYKDKPEQTLTL